MSRTLTYYYSYSDLNYESHSGEIKAMCQEKGIDFIGIEIDSIQGMEEKYKGNTPIILIGPYTLKNPFNLKEVEIAIDAVRKRDDEDINSTNPKSQFTIRMSGLERFSLWFSKRYAFLISTFLLIYVLIPVLAPILEENGYTKIANVIYKTYSILCHQLAYRSFFIGGDQPYYPRELANIENYKTYEEVTGFPAEDIIQARNLHGNAILGYKIALCERDLAIYLSMAFVGIFFELRHKKFLKLPWYLWIFLALIPIALDGLSQLPSLASGWPNWLPIRESTPLLRVITGTLFGGGTAWYMYPIMEESVSETRFQLARKEAIAAKYSQGQTK